MKSAFLNPKNFYIAGGAMVVRKVFLLVLEKKTPKKHPKKHTQKTPTKIKKLPIIKNTQKTPKKKHQFMTFQKKTPKQKQP